MALLLCLVLTGWASYANRVQANERAKIRFHQEVNRSTSAIHARLELYEDALYGTRSFLTANSKITRSAFHDYVANLRMRERYPGIQGIGLALRFSASERAEHIEKVRREGFPQYTIRPENKRDEYTSVVYLEPFDWRNQRAFGYDMFTEPVRRAAMERARDTGSPSISGKVTLVQETEPTAQAGFLMYLPMYRKNAAVNTSEDKRSALLGYVYSPFRMNDLMQGMVLDPSPLAAFEIFSGNEMHPDSLMYRSAEANASGWPLLTENTEIDFGGQAWTLRFSSLPSLNTVVTENRNLLIVPVGIVASVLFSGLILLSGRTEARAIRIAETMTAKLKDSEQSTRAITESAADAIISADAEGRIIYFNSSAERIFGHLASEVQGKLITTLMPERFRAAHQSGLNRYLLTGETHVIGRSMELTGLRKNGTELPVSLSLATWKAGTAICFTGILQDITERKKAEESLRQSEERYRSLFDLNPHPVWVYDRATLRFLAVNQAAEATYGYSQEEFLALTILDIRPSEDVPALLKRISSIRDGQRATGVWRHRTKHNRSLDVEVSSYSFVFKGAHADLVIAVDITGRKQAEREISSLNVELRQRNTELTAINSELETFSYSVSHDLRAPLRALDGFSAALLEDCQERLGPEGRQYLDHIRAAATRMGQLIDDLLRLARTSRQKLNPEQVNMSSLAQEITSQLQDSEPRRKSAFTIAPHLVAEGDRGLLRLLLENLLGNAWKFTGKQEQTCIEFGQQARSGEKVYFVADNGAGFDMRYANKLFGAFQRLHNESEFPGTGIGLATAQRVVHRHGGRIWAEGSTGKGATFYFSLNLDTADRAATGEA